MSKGPPRSRTTPSNRFSHGLASKTQKEIWFPEAELLARELVGTPSAPLALWDVALELALNSFLIRSAKKERILLLSTQMPRLTSKETSNTTYVEETRYYCAINPDFKGMEAAAEVLRLRWRELRRVDEYERKALSRQKELARQLDYLIIEASRREFGFG